jgi:hypothetical protein
MRHLERRLSRISELGRGVVAAMTVLVLGCNLAAASPILHYVMELDAVPGGNSGLLQGDASDNPVLGTVSGTPGAIVFIDLVPGVWQVTPIKTDEFTAWRRWNYHKNCEADGTGCTEGWEWSFRYFFLEDWMVGDPAVNVNQSRPFEPNFFRTAQLAYDSVAGAPITLISLAEQRTVGFFIHDNILGDNRGGVAMEISRIPLPAGAWLMVLALGGLGIAGRKRRVVV